MNQKILLCFGKGYCVSENFFIFRKKLLCSRMDCCVRENIVVFSKRLLRSKKRLLCSRKGCRVPEDKLSCVLPLYATVEYSAQGMK